MADSWTFAVARDDLSRTTLADGAAPALADGEALLRVDRVGLTANNVTYGVLGEAFRYWEFFPTEPGLGVVPLWGFTASDWNRDSRCTTRSAHGVLEPQ